MTNILIVEDNEMNRDMISRRLSKKGFNISMAVDGEEGIKKAHSEKPDLILMDLSLPKIDGWEATRQLKAASETRAIPIIALTAHAMAGDREKALDAGCNDYDTKPVDFNRLIEKINCLLALQAGNQTAPKATAPAPTTPAPAAPKPVTPPPEDDLWAEAHQPVFTPAQSIAAQVKPAPAPTPAVPVKPTAPAVQPKPAAPAAPARPAPVAAQPVAAPRPAPVAAAPAPVRPAPAAPRPAPTPATARPAAAAPAPQPAAPRPAPAPVKAPVEPDPMDMSASLAEAMAAEAELAELDNESLTDVGASPAPMASVAKHMKSRHLLIVDDNENNRDMLARRFEKQGYTTETASNGEDALEMIALKKFDAVLLDVMMPGIDGVEVLRRIRKKQSLVELPVIMVTAKGEREDLVNALEAGANDFIPKPVDFLIALARTRTQLHLKDEHEKSERLLLNILPKLVADMLKRDSENFAERYPEATVMFADIVGFTKMSGGLEAKVLVRLLNEIFSAFDDLALKYDLEKIKTMGDGYMVVGGVPIPRLDHADAIAMMALEMRDFVKDFNRRLRQPLGIRIGIATGPVVAGVIGKSKFAYDLWGDTVNIASRMESHGQNGMIQVNRETAHMLDGKFEVKKRGTIEVKGKGQMETFFLMGKAKD